MPEPIRVLRTSTAGLAIAVPQPAATSAPGSRRLLRQLPYALKAMRPKQWIKNGLIVVAAIFAHRALDLPTVERVAMAFGAFSLLASAIYIMNDIADRERDRLHPKKRLRPIASGRLSVPLAVCFSVLSLGGSAALVTWLVAQQQSEVARGVLDPFANWGGSPILVVVALASYLVLNIAYSYWMKHQVLWDVLVIAAGFVLRAVVGAFAAMVVISPWFYLCALFLSLFLALGKRRAELVAVKGEVTRASLRHYSLQLLDQLMTVVVACTLITYSLYTFQTPGSGNLLMITIPFVIFGVFRYLYLVYVQGEGESPDTLLLRDGQILAAVGLCLLVVFAVLYGEPLARGLQWLPFQ